MTQEEYQIQYTRLQDVHPFVYKSQEKMQTIWKFVHDMDASWFQNIVDNICAASDARLEKYDIGQAVIGEKRARKSAKFAEDICEATKNWKNITDDGLSHVLGKYKAKSLLEAIGMSRKGELGEETTYS